MYKKNEWVDRQVQYPMTFTMTQNENGTITLTPYPGVVSEEGTKITASIMNNIENGIAENLVPTGSILSYAGNNAPEGWLICDGSAISRSDYSDLFNILGTLYGEGDGSTTFNIPDMRGRVAVGLNSSGNFNNLGKEIGEETHTLSINEIPSHNHTPSSLGSNWVYNTTSVSRIQIQKYNSGDYRIPSSDEGLDAWKWGNTGDTGGSQSHNNIQPSLVINYIIKT